MKAKQLAAQFCSSSPKTFNMGVDDSSKFTDALIQLNNSFRDDFVNAYESRQIGTEKAIVSLIDEFILKWHATIKRIHITLSKQYDIQGFKVLRYDGFEQSLKLSSKELWSIWTRHKQQIIK